MNKFINKTILVTGGTGSFGSNFIKKLLKSFKFKKIIVFSRDELKQFELKNSIENKYKKNIRFFIGDIRDLDRLNIAFNNVDFVVHAAALKQVETAEYNPTEFIKTNIIGAENIIKASINNKVKKVIALSTDKAVQPINLYGASKLASDKLFIAANNMFSDKVSKFSIVRYGNVIGSRGSVVPFFKNLIAKKSQFLPITHNDMTRFWITMDQAIDFVVDSLNTMKGGEIFVPKLPSIKITDLAKAMAPKIKLKIIGIRNGEKLHEALCQKEEARFTYEFKDKYIVKPNILNTNAKTIKLSNNMIGKKVRVNFEYTSENNNNFLSIAEIKKLNDKVGK